MYPVITNSFNCFGLKPNVCTANFNSFNIFVSDINLLSVDNVTDNIAKGWIEDFFATNQNLDLAFTNLIYGPPDATGD